MPGRNSPAAIQVIANPAAGADFTFTLTYARRLVAVFANYLPSAVVANRFPHLEFLAPSGAVLFYAMPPPAIVASANLNISWYPASGVNTAIADAAINIPMADIQLPAQSKIQSVTTGIQVADQWANVKLLFEG